MMHKKLVEWNGMHVIRYNPQTKKGLMASHAETDETARKILLALHATSIESGYASRVRQIKFTCPEKQFFKGLESLHKRNIPITTLKTLGRLLWEEPKA